MRKLFTFLMVALFSASVWADFYITGSAVGGWVGNEVHAIGDSYTIENLAADSYQLKVTCNGTWSGDYNVYGYDALTAKIGGLYRGTGGSNDNICFTLTEPGDVVVTFIKNGNDVETFTVEGDFEMPPIQIAGSWDSEWKDIRTFEPATDKVTASVTINLTNTYYEFQLIDNGTWKGKWINNDDDYFHLTRSVLSVNNLEHGKHNIVIKPDVAGNYKFTWTYATGVLSVEFPDPDTVYYMAGSMFTDGDWDKALAPMTKTAGIWSKNVDFASTDYKEFKIVRSVEGIYVISQAWIGLSAAHTITATTVDLVLDDDSNSAKAVGITPSKAGEYVFAFNPDGNKLSVTYPAYIYTIVSTFTSMDKTATVGDMAKQGDTDTYLLQLSNVDHVVKGSYDIEVYREHAGEPVATKTLDIAASGKYNIDFTFDASEEDPTKALVVEALYQGPATAVDNTEVEGKAAKVIRDGQLLIVKDGKTFNVLGTVVR